MKYLKRIMIIVCLLCMACYGLLAMILGYPVVLNISSNVQCPTITYIKGQTINPLNIFNFSSDEWTAYLLISNEDYKLIKGDLIGSKLVTKDISVLNLLKKECEFTYTDGDLSTVTSSFVLYKNGEKVFETGLVIEKSMQGFQSQDYGWITAKHNLINAFNRFDKIKSPMVVLK
jgi:hypothetical protein